MKIPLIGVLSCVEDMWSQTYFCVRKISILFQGLPLLVRFFPRSKVKVELKTQNKSHALNKQNKNCSDLYI